MLTFLFWNSSAFSSALWFSRAWNRHIAIGKCLLFFQAILLVYFSVINLINKRADSVHFWTSGVLLVVFRYPCLDFAKPQFKSDQDIYFASSFWSSVSKARMYDTVHTEFRAMQNETRVLELWTTLYVLTLVYVFVHLCFGECLESLFSWKHLFYPSQLN